MNYHSKLQAVKESVDIIEVAKYYGLNLNRANKTLCVFHSERTASLSFSQSKQIFKCFGCDTSGDVLTLVSKLLNINVYEAAKIINNDFGCGVDFDRPVNRFAVNKYQHQKEVVKQFNEWINKAFNVLCDYYKELKRYKQDIKHPRFVEALQNIDKIEYYIDFLMDADEQEKVKFWKHNKKVVSELEKRLVGK